jgi:cold shock protein
MEGKIKFFNTQKGFGFIIGDDGKDYFTHISNCIEKELMKDTPVTFELEQGKRGVKAIKVERKG